MTTQSKLLAIKEGFSTLRIEQIYKDRALVNIERWLTGEEFTEYVPQIDYLIESRKWDLLLDCFYQVVPFGTGGRRGPVGIGPNRINMWTIQTSAQGHSQYLLKQFGDEAKERGIIIAYDVRAYLNEIEYDTNRPNPVYGLDCKTLAMKASEVYVANGIKVKMFTNFTPTPELSFMVRELNAVAGLMISASHNPPDHNGQKVINETGGQLVPPYDQNLVDVVVNEVDRVQLSDYEESRSGGLITDVTGSQHRRYIDEAKAISLNKTNRDVKIMYSPMHGTSFETVPTILSELGFNVVSDKPSSVPDPRFSTIVFNIPNPEVMESFANIIPQADGVGADIILSADPDADRIGLMSKEKDQWRFYSGNEIGVLITKYMLTELKDAGKLLPSNVIVKTVVTTNLVSVLAKSYGIKIESDLLVGFKYIAEIMDNLEVSGKITDFLFGMEESHGYTAGNYIREKDAVVAAILIAELASKLKNQGMTLGQFLDSIYEEYGYFLNYLTEIRLPGAEGMSSIAKIQNYFRERKPQTFGDFKVKSFTDRWDGDEFLSPTDKDSRNLLILNFETGDLLHQLQVIVRPSGTEPKLKIYLEIGVKPDPSKTLGEIKDLASGYKDQLEKKVITFMYSIIGINFPERGFLLFWQLPAQSKMKYFEIEPEIANLKSVIDPVERKLRLDKLLAFLGSDPVVKVDKAFRARYETGILEYLDLS